MRIQASREFSTWFTNIKNEGGPVLTRAGALLGALRDLQAKPAVESATLKRVRQATRHEIWRVAHPFDPAVAVRVLCWFPRRRDGGRRPHRRGQGRHQRRLVRLGDAPG